MSDLHSRHVDRLYPVACIHGYKVSAWAPSSPNRRIFKYSPLRVSPRTLAVSEILPLVRLSAVPMTSRSTSSTAAARLRAPVGRLPTTETTPAPEEEGSAVRSGES